MPNKMRVKTSYQEKDDFDARCCNINFTFLSNTFPSLNTFFFSLRTQFNIGETFMFLILSCFVADFPGIFSKRRCSLFKQGESKDQTGCLLWKRVVNGSPVQLSLSVVCILCWVGKKKEIGDPCQRLEKIDGESRRGDRRTWLLHVKTLRGNLILW